MFSFLSSWAAENSLHGSSVKVFISSLGWSFWFGGSSWENRVTQYEHQSQDLPKYSVMLDTFGYSPDIMVVSRCNIQALQIWFWEVLNLGNLDRNRCQVPAVNYWKWGGGWKVTPSLPQSKLDMEKEGSFCNGVPSVCWHSELDWLQSWREGNLAGIDRVWGARHWQMDLPNLGQWSWHLPNTL